MNKGLFQTSHTVLNYTFIFLRFYLFIFKEMGREGESEGEKHQCVFASHWPPLGAWPTTQAYTLTGS